MNKNDEFAAQVRAALDAELSTREHYANQRAAGIDLRNDYSDMDDAAAEIRVHAPDWLRALLAERERLVAVARVAEAIVYDAEHDHHLATNWATERLKRALDALKG